jgi:hypothetical protein
MIFPFVMSLKQDRVPINPDASTLARQLPKLARFDESLNAVPPRFTQIFLAGLNLVLKVFIAMHAVDDQGESEQLAQALLGSDDVEHSGWMAEKHESVRFADNRGWPIQRRLMQALEGVRNRTYHGNPPPTT